MNNIVYFKAPGIVATDNHPLTTDQLMTALQEQLEALQHGDKLLIVSLSDKKFKASIQVDEALIPYEQENYSRVLVLYNDEGLTSLLPSIIPYPKINVSSIRTKLIRAFHFEEDNRDLEGAQALFADLICQFAGPSTNDVIPRTREIRNHR